MFGSINTAIIGEENMGAYFILSIILTIIVNAIAMVLLKKIPPSNVRENIGTDKQVTDMERDNLEGASYSDEDKEDRGLKPQEKNKLIEVSKPLKIIYFGEYNICQSMQVSDFHLVLWPFVLSTAVSFMYSFSLQVFLKSFDLQDLQAGLILAGSILAAVCKFAAGIVSDITLTLFPRVWYLLGTLLLQTLVTLLSCFIGDQTALVIISGLIQFASLGVFMAMIPILASDNFGTTYFASTWGTITLVGGIASLAMSYTMGAFYDLEIEGDSDTCYGLKCFRVIFIISSVFCVASFIMLGILYKKQAKQWSLKQRLAGVSNIFEDKDE